MPHRPLVSRSPYCVLLALGLVLAAGCGGDDREARLQVATQAVTEARERVEEARQAVADKEAAVEQAEAELFEAREELREAKLSLGEAEAQVDLHATDALLFRAVQKRLLEDRRLENVGVAARVRQGVVTLSGRVPDASLRDRALDVARTTPGVSEVRSEIEVEKAP